MGVGETRGIRASTPRRTDGKRLLFRKLGSAFLALLLAFGAIMTGPLTASGDDEVVGRVDATFMHGRNRIILTDTASLRAADIQVENSDKGVVIDRTISLHESGDHDEYVVNMTDAATRPVAVTATYRRVGYDPQTRELVGCVMRFSDFTLTSAAFWNACKAQFRGHVKADPAHPGAWNTDAQWFNYPSLRLAGNFSGGYWMLGVEHCKIDLYFFYGDDTNRRVDLSNAFITIQSLDYDSNGITGFGNNNGMGHEAVKPENIYRKIFLTEESKVGRFGDIRGFSGTTYQGDYQKFGSAEDQVCRYFYQREPTDASSPRSDLAITFFGVKDGSNTFSFDMVDTAAWTHNMPYFGTIGAVEPPKPIKEVDSTKAYRLGDTVVWKVSQYVPGRDEMLGSYTSFIIEDDMDRNVRVDSIRVVQEDGIEVTTGTKSNPGESHVRYEFDLAQEDIYGHTYTLLIETTVVDYPEDPDLRIPNRASTTFNGTFRQETNEVAVVLQSPELQVEKHADTSHHYASAIAGFEYLSHDRHPSTFSTVHYVGTLNNIEANTRAKNVVIKDILPQGLNLVQGSGQCSGADGIEVEEDGNVLRITLPQLDSNTPITFSYDCTTNDNGNGREIVNRVNSWADNIERDIWGNEHKKAFDEGEIYVNDPVIKVAKRVSESPIQNDDYQGDDHQQREEYRVGDEFTYTVNLENTSLGTFSHNLVLRDDQMPSGLELVGDIRVEGLGAGGQGPEIFYPLAGTSDSIHSEGETRTVQWHLEPVEEAFGRWGWELFIDYLPAQTPVKVIWTVRATQAVNGWEIYNQAEGTTENAPGDRFLSENPCVWVNTPEFQVQKYVSKTDGAYDVGDVAAYNIELFGLATPGTLARNTTLEDTFTTEGTTILENSFVITDRKSEARNIADRIDLHRNVGDQHWKIDLAQVYGDETGYWVNEDDYLVWNEGTLTRQNRQNPVGASQHDYLKVHYEATINDMALQNTLVENRVTAESDEGFPKTDQAQVTVIGAQLDIEKDANDGGSFEVGSIADYRLTIRNNAKGTVAENVQIQDAFTTSKAGAVEIIADSLQLYDNRQNPIKGWDVTFKRNEAGTPVGFAIDTHYDLDSADKLTLAYKVRHLTNNGFSVLKNVADTWADNAPEVSDFHETRPRSKDTSDLVVEKGSDKQRYSAGETALYHLRITNRNKESAAENVVITDEIDLDALGIASLVRNSVEVRNSRGEVVPAAIVYLQAESGRLKGFTVETGYRLASDDFLEVTYRVRIADSVAQTTLVHNDCEAAADNTGKAKDSHDVEVPKGTKPQDSDDFGLVEKPDAPENEDPTSPGNGDSPGNDVGLNEKETPPDFPQAFRGWIPKTGDQWSVYGLGAMALVIVSAVALITLSLFKKRRRP